MDNQENHRQSFRINDRVALLVRRLDGDELQRANAVFEARRRDLVQAPGSDLIADYKKFSLAQVQKRCPEAHAYIAYLEEKIEKLQRSATACESSLPVFPTDLVNLSTSGVQFQSGAELPEGAVIEVALRLFPSQAALLFFARVTRCEPIADKKTHGWGVGASFTHIDARDRELLARHIHKYQLDALSLAVN